MGFACEPAGLVCTDTNCLRPLPAEPQSLAQLHEAANYYQFLATEKDDPFRLHCAELTGQTGATEGQDRSGSSVASSLLPKTGSRTRSTAENHHGTDGSGGGHRIATCCHALQHARRCASTISNASGAPAAGRFGPVSGADRLPGPQPRRLLLPDRVHYGDPPPQPYIDLSRPEIVRRALRRAFRACWAGRTSRTATTSMASSASRPTGRGERLRSVTGSPHIATKCARSPGVFASNPPSGWWREKELAACRSCDRLPAKIDEVAANPRPAAGTERTAGQSGIPAHVRVSHAQPAALPPSRDDRYHWPPENGVVSRIVLRSASSRWRGDRQGQGRLHVGRRRRLRTGGQRPTGRSQSVGTAPPGRVRQRLPRRCSTAADRGRVPVPPVAAATTPIGVLALSEPAGFPDGSAAVGTSRAGLNGRPVLPCADGRLHCGRVLADGSRQQDRCVASRGGAVVLFAINDKNGRRHSPRRSCR